MTDDPRTERTILGSRSRHLSTCGHVAEGVTTRPADRSDVPARCCHRDTATSPLPAEAGDVEPSRILLSDYIAAKQAEAAARRETCAHEFQTRPTIGPPYDPKPSS